MHPLTTFELHRQDQHALLGRSTGRPQRPPLTRRDDAHGRPPDPRDRESARRSAPVVARRVPLA